MAAPQPAARHVHLDPLGGVSGDMFLGALLDAWPHLLEGTVAAMRAAGLPQSWRVELVPHRDTALSGRRMVIEPPAAEGAEEAEPTGAYHGIRRRLAASPLAAGVRERAALIFAEIARAEAEVHGVLADDVHFHELADWDSVADVVGAAYLIEALGPATWSTAPLPLGGGRVMTSHGWLPVPAPATARLLAGMAVVDDGITGERVTPTGAAILRHLGAGSGLPPGPMRLAASGIGFGSRRLRGISNALRVLAYEAAAAGGQGREVVGVAECTIDDQTPEELAAGLDALRAHPGVLEALQIPGLGKKGRVAARVEVLARREMLDEVIDACLAETTTIGVRHRLEARTTLARSMVAVPDGEAGGEATVKVVTRPDGTRTAKADIDSVAPTGGQTERSRRRRRAEAAALEDEDDGGAAD